MDTPKDLTQYKADSSSATGNDKFQKFWLYCLNSYMVVTLPTLCTFVFIILIIWIWDLLKRRLVLKILCRKLSLLVSCLLRDVYYTYFLCLLCVKVNFVICFGVHFLFEFYLHLKGPYFTSANPNLSICINIFKWHVNNVSLIQACKGWCELMQEHKRIFLNFSTRCLIYVLVLSSVQRRSRLHSCGASC